MRRLRGAEEAITRQVQGTPLDLYLQSSVREPQRFPKPFVRTIQLDQNSSDLPRSPSRRALTDEELQQSKKHHCSSRCSTCTGCACKKNGEPCNSSCGCGDTCNNRSQDDPGYPPAPWTYEGGDFSDCMLPADCSWGPRGVPAQPQMYENRLAQVRTQIDREYGGEESSSICPIIGKKTTTVYAVWNTSNA